MTSYDVVVTTYEMAASPSFRAALTRRCAWRYLVLDEAHRIKNEQSQAHERLAAIPSAGKLLLTGTPLQNNLHELWALLHFLHPEIFASSDAFDRAFDHSRGLLDERVVSQVGELLGSFVLRRLKAQVLSGLPPKRVVRLRPPMSRTQFELSKELLQQKSDLLERIEQGAALADDGADDDAIGGSQPDWRAANHLLAALRKCYNHPYLFEGLEHASTTYGEGFVEASGKLHVVDRLLRRRLGGGHRVVIFAGHTSTLDVLERLCAEREYVCARLDGATCRVQRTLDVRSFNASTRQQIFLCSTRAGGLGISLTAADTVVLYDSDFNPQVDRQAMDRVHRIGQTRPVTVYRLVTRGSVEERIVERAADKLGLEAMVHASTNGGTAAGLSGSRRGRSRAPRRSGCSASPTRAPSAAAPTPVASPTPRPRRSSTPPRRAPTRPTRRIPPTKTRPPALAAGGGGSGGGGGADGGVADAGGGAAARQDEADAGE